MTKGTLQVYTAFTITCRSAVDRLRQEYYGGNSYPGSSQQLREALDRLRTEKLPETLKDADAEYYAFAHRLSEALFEQLMVSHRMLELMYEGESGRFLHSHLLEEACGRAETVLGTILDMAMEAALGTPKSSVRA